MLGQARNLKGDSLQNSTPQTPVGKKPDTVICAILRMQSAKRIVAGAVLERGMDSNPLFDGDSRDGGNETVSPPREDRFDMLAFSIQICNDNV